MYKMSKEEMEKNIIKTESIRNASVKLKRF